MILGAGILKCLPPFPSNSKFYLNIVTMKKQHILILSVLLPLAGLVLTGCRQKAEQKDTRTQFEKYLTNQDSLKVIELIDQFFFYAEQGNYADAAAMLYKAEVDTTFTQPEPLGNEEMESVATMLKVLGIQGHRIDYIKFREANMNEVKCTAILQPALDGQPEATTVLYFKPIDFVDSWVLCLMHSETGNETFVSEDEKAQLTREFKADQAARLQQQAEAEQALKANQDASSEHPQ